MGKIYISVGISGSGKSRFAETFCKTSEAIELNADNYRKALGKGVNDQDINKVVFEEIDKCMARVRVLKTDAVWQGITYREDKDKVVNEIRKLVLNGEYPEGLWK